MSLLKKLVFTMMYIYIFVFLINEKSLILAFFLLITGISYIKLYCKNVVTAKQTKNRLKEQRDFFVNSLSHDLRIPVIAQIRALDIIKDEKIGTLNQEQKEMLIQVQDSCKYLLNLISLMINTYNIENYTYKPIYEIFNLTDVIISCFEELKIKASEKNITFELERFDYKINVFADKNDLKKVILNILSASLDNTEIGHHVLLKINKFNNKIRLTIFSDNNNFYAEMYGNSFYAAIGKNIIMNFCEKIIELNNGSIIKNDIKNSFTLELPVYSA